MTAEVAHRGGHHCAASAFALIVVTGAMVRSPHRLGAADATIPVERATGAMEATTDDIRSYVWHFHFSRHRLADPDDPTTLSDPLPNDYIDGEFLYDRVGGRYLMEFERVTPWSGGATPYIAMRTGWSFDGHVYRRWQRDRHGTEVPSLNTGDLPGGDGSLEEPLDTSSGPLFGTITAAQEAQGEFSAYAIASGLVYLPPHGCLWSSEDRRVLWTLPELLRSLTSAGRQVRITEVADGTWRVEMPADRFGETLLFSVDPARSFALTEAEVRREGAAYRKWATRIEQIGENVWMPVEVTDYNVLSGQVDRTVITDLTVNPELTDEDFSIRFPIGTQVEDFIEEKFYLAGAGAGNDAQAVEDFIQRNKLNTLPVDTDLSPWTPGRRVLILLNVVVLILALLFLLWRRRRSHRQVRSILVVSLGLIGSAAHAGELSPSGDWIARHSGDGDIRISQCGFNVAVFTLMLCERQFDPSRLSECLKPTGAGILMSDLKTAIEAHGLEVDSRDAVSINDLADALRPSQLAVFPVLLQGSVWHYFVAFTPVGRHLVVADPPHRLLQIDELTADARARKGLALIITRNADADVPLSKLIAIDPEPVDLGSFSLVGEAAGGLPVEITLRNTASRPIMINGVAASCGCTAPNWRGGIIHSGEKVAMTLTVDRQAWGVGVQQREIRFDLPDGSKRRLTIVGDAVVDERDSGLRVSRKDVTFEVPRVGFQIPYRASRDILLGAANQRSLEGIHLDRGDCTWLSGLLHVDDGELRLRAEVCLNRSELQTLLSHRPVNGELRITDRNTQHLTNVHVAAVVRQGFRAVPALIDVRTEGLAEGASVRILCSEEGIVDWEVSRVWSEPSGLGLSVGERDTESLLIRCDTEESSPQLTYLCHCEVKGAGTLPEIVSFVVRVRK